MPVADFAHNVQTSFLAMPGYGRVPAAMKAAPAPTAQAAANSDHKSFWADLLDVVNPLQHLPVVGTIYRSVTGDKMGDLEKVAGDTLYGGPLGLVSSLADVAFEKITGKDFGDTVLSFVTGGDKTTAVASAAKPLSALPARTTASSAPIVLAPAQPAPAAPQAKVAQAQTASPQDANTEALMAAMNQDGVNSDLGMRALFAYQKSMGLTPSAPGGLSAAP